MRTRQKRLDYRVLNDGSDEEALPEDRIDQSSKSLSNLPPPLLVSEEGRETITNVPDGELLPSESASQLPTSQQSSTDTGTSVTSSGVFHRHRQRLAPATEWIWAYFETTAVDRPWFIKKTNKRKLVDREIRCLHVDKKTGIRCEWQTSDSQRQNTTSNMKTHLAKHDIYAPTSNVQPAKKQPDIRSFLDGKENLTHQEVLERNVIRWVVTDMNAFTTVESPEFQQIFRDIPGIEPPFTSRHTLRDRIVQEFYTQRAELKSELALTCRTIALSLDVWTSQNHLPILGIIGHWLTEGFEYQERLLEFTELQGTHSGENLASAVENMLIELNLEHKLISITGDNASNNEAMASELYFSLSNRLGEQDTNSALLYRGLDSYIRCLAHVLNLIVKDILRALNSGDTEQAQAVCDSLQDGHSITNQSAIERLRILALWINRNPQRRQNWKEICRLNDLPDKFIEHDVATRWNSTFRMIHDGLKSRQQVNKFLSLQNELPPFTVEDWSRLEQIHLVLDKFNELTSFVSKRNPQISLAVPIYYELHELLDDASEQNGDFVNLDQDIAAAVKGGMKKYEKYYSIMDDCDTYYTALVLDPRVKGELILRELQDGNAGTMILDTIRTNLHQRYEASNLEHDGTTLQQTSTERDDVESRMLKKLQVRDQSLVSDINRYFETPPISAADTTGQNWLCNWWRMHKEEYPQMAAAARDYLAIPASEVAVERLFSTARDVLGIRRHSLKGDTIRILMLTRDGFK
jgi:hypothetical protein